METKVTAVNGHGHLTIGGLDTVALASKYGTPLYVMDEDAIRANCRALKNSMDAHYHKKGLVLYASKAFCCKRMYRILNEEGLGADVVSGGELYTALQAGFPAERIYFHGNNKTADELTMALESGVGRIVVDNIAELELLGALAKAAGKTASVLFRIKPGIDAHTHNFIRTGQIDSNSALRWRRAKRCRLWLRRSRHRASVWRAFTVTSARRSLISILSAMQPK